MNKFYLILIVCCFAFSAGYASAATIDDLGGTVEAEVEGKRVLFPTLKTDVTADVQGDLATVTVKQVFQNPTHTPLNARYLFPLNKDAAVYAMTMEVGDEIVQAVIKKKEEAKKTFEKAKREGRAASLLTQHRPNMFTQNLANLMPGLPITVTLKYTQAIPKKDDYYELVVPLIVGPRYQPASAGVPPTIRDGDELVAMPDIRSDTAFGKWELEALPEYPDVAGLTIPDTIDKDRVSIRVNLNAAMPIQHIHSRTHEVKTEGEDKAQTVQLVQGRTIDNRDFVLCYQLAGENTAAGMLTAKNERGGYFSLMIEPPAMPDNAEITAREMVFVLDTSGSMSGEPISASKLFMKHAVQHLRPKDYFRIIRFSDSATEYTESPVPATPENVMNGLAYVNSLTANGGTNAMSSIDQAFLVPPHPGTLRIVVFLTDGYIGNESSILEEIHRKIGKARIYAFGIGTSVNRYLLSEMGRAGRGFARFIDPTEDTEDVAIELANKLESPVLTDIAIEWDGILAGHVTPAVIPDLFAGDSIRVQGRFEGSGEHTIKVHGRVAGRKAVMPVKVILPDAQTPPETDAIPLIWARSQIADWMRELNLPEGQKASDFSKDELKTMVTELGLDYSLVTKWTSFVAVSKKVYNADPASAKDANVPLHKVKGVSNKAYGNQAAAPQRLHFAGNSAPEPGVLGGLAVIAAAGYFATRRRKKV